METNPGFTKYMDQYFNYLGQWDSPSKCGLKIVKRRDGQTMAIATEIYRQNPGTPVTEWCAQLATQIMIAQHCTPGSFIFVEHTPDLRSKLDFYNETFDMITFESQGLSLVNPTWSHLTREEVDAMMEQ